MTESKEKTKDQIAFAVLMFVFAVLSFFECRWAFNNLSYSSRAYFTLFAPTVLFEISFIVLGVMLLVKTDFGAKKYAALASVCLIEYGICQSIMYYRHFYQQYFLFGVSLMFLAAAGFVLMRGKSKKTTLIAMVITTLVFGFFAMFYKIFCLVRTLNNHDFTKYEGYDYFGNYYSDIIEYRKNGVLEIIGLAAFLLAYILLVVFLYISIRHEKGEDTFQHVWFIPGVLFFAVLLIVWLIGYNGYHFRNVAVLFFTAALLLFGYWINRDYKASFITPKGGSYHA
ncbi:MAG: hypothetical protein J5584_01115 [Clostridia bacterium]|nr:hypothetical protein [Clostridia bacterium]